MASWVFCNRCFQPPQATSCFSLTNCGHVYCDVCLRKGKRDECLICKVACRTILLSKHISEFQEKHRRRLLAFYGEKISQLEESLRKSTLRVEQLQRVRSSQQAVFSTVKTPASTPSARPNGPLFQSRDSSASERVESMEVDLTPSPRRKPEVTAGPPRISLLSPPRDGRMGSIAHRPQHLGLMPRCASEPQALRIPALQMPCEWPRQSPAPAAGRGAAPRQPISISGLMQRHQGLPALGDLCTSESRLLPSGCPRGAHA
ncbi:probable E3 SUMO-protein ligase RNF212 isoform X2 [Cervus elaphus]|uniref:probable E3 SUMO-protein ligase RNF212 isoform X2 n=1 Tax=Cervus canadensis TaxID=1574408 RepID=UPI001CA3679B|nr:probable E3 SUMO-protein ligase RNF212 isoform X2 [Cervus canadensis]XP_043761866.1 probable E3 SUMO-protein ligase RNF212 isoform X2 [Cervus elaphus]